MMKYHVGGWIDHVPTQFRVCIRFPVFYSCALIDFPSFSFGGAWTINLTKGRLEKSRSQRVLWLLEELKIEYEVKTYKRLQMLEPPELKKVHPLGKAPILVIESDARQTPLVLAESGNIIEYLIDHYGSRLAPKKFLDGKEGEVGGETEEWLRYRYYMHYAEGTMMVYLVVALIVRSALHFPFIRSALLSIQLQISETPLHSFSGQLPMPSPAQLNPSFWSRISRITSTFSKQKSLLRQTMASIYADLSFREPISS